MRCADLPLLFATSISYLNPTLHACLTFSMDLEPELMVVVVSSPGIQFTAMIVSSVTQNFIS